LRSITGTTLPRRFNHAAHIVGTVGQAGRATPGADFPHRHDVDAELLLADREGDILAGLETVGAHARFRQIGRKTGLAFAEMTHERY
jgi:hypothetical protein